MNELWEEWTVHYERNNLNSDTICKDGIIDENKFLEASTKVLFILKEVNDFEGGDLREMLQNGPVYQMWHTIARWAAGILNDFPLYKKIDTSECMKESLSRLAAINLKKKSGGAVADWFEINAYAHQDRHLLIKQINQINPDVIIACGVFEILIWLLDLEVNPESPEERPVELKLESQQSIWVVPWRHPGRVNNRKSYESLGELARKAPGLATLIHNKSR